MPKFTFTSPEGKIYDVEGPQGATKEQAFQILQQRLAKPESQKPAPVNNPPAPNPQEKNFLEKVADYNPVTGAGEAALNMGTGMIAKPVSDVAGLAAMGYEMATGKGGDPSGFKNHVQDALTYQPRTTAGKYASEYNPIALVGKGIGKVSDMAGNAIAGDRSSTARSIAGDFTREAIPQAAGFLGIKGLKTKGVNPELTPTQEAFVKLREKGNVAPPSYGKPSMLNDFIEGHVLGKAKTEQGMSIKNARINAESIKKDFGIPEGEVLTPEALADVRAHVGESYAGIKEVVPVLKSSEKYRAAIKDLSGDKYKAATKEFPTHFKNKEITALQKTLNVESMSTEAAMEMVKSLREQSKINKSGMSKTNASMALGDAQINAANAIEGLIAERLEAAGHPELFKQMLDARKTIAQTYVVENALSGNGTVSAKAIAKSAKAAKKNGVLFSGSLADIAENYQNFPKAFQDMGQVGLSPSGSPLTMAAAIDAALHGKYKIAAGIASKGAIRPVITSDWYQNLSTPPKPGPRNPNYAYGALIPVRPKTNKEDGK